MSLVSSDLNQATPDKATMNTAKPDKHRAISELKNGKIVFKQKPLSFDNLSETMQEIVSFRSLLQTSDAPLASIPEEHLPLIAKLVHESDKSLGALTKTLQSSLIPPAVELSQESEPAATGDVLPTSILEQAIKTVAERTNYGITVDKPPAAMCVWRWEAKNREWLPHSVREKATARFNERVASKKHLQTLFDDLPDDEKVLILKAGKASKPSKSKECSTEVGVTESRISPSPVQEQQNDASGSNESNMKKADRPKKPVDPEVVAKEKERQEKKAMKAEKEKRTAEANKRSAAAFANFFKTTTMSSKAGESSKVAPAEKILPSSAPSTSTPLSEFETTFKPFVIKKDAQLAPINWFLARKHSEGLQPRRASTKKSTQEAIIELDDEGRELARWPKDQCVPMDSEPQEDVSNLSPRALICSFLASQPPSLHPVPRSLPSRRLSNSKPSYIVREIIDQLSEAEVGDDQRTVHRLTALLKNRQKIPAKVFVFTENVRPGYLGTWTKRSSTIGPRTPFARDLLSFDYDHDSDAEWEEEEDGDDVDSPDETMEDDMSSVGSDLNGWLVEGDQVEVEATVPEGLSLLSLPNPSKRKVASETHEHANKKRKVVPLIPFYKGPNWEKEIGHREYEPFRGMRIQIFNDTPLPIDPFTFTSEPFLIDKTNPSATQKDGDRAFAIPALPDRLVSAPALVAQPSTSDSHRGKRKSAPNSAPPPKTTFPDMHLPVLFQKIGASNTNSFAVLLDSVFQDIKSLGIKKNALEVKLREVAEKDKVTKRWVVKEDVWTRYGLVKPA